MDAQTCIQIASCHDSAVQASQALIHEARERWLSQGDYMDDITAIVIFIDAHNAQGSDVEDGRKALVEDSDSDEGEIPLGFSAQFWTLFAGAASGFLGGLSGIRGPPIILYFLHPPYPVSFDKKTQRATGASITATNVIMRVAYYLVETFAFDGESFFESSDWVLYVSIVLCSLAGVLVGTKLFELMKDSRATIRMILSIFLLLCGLSLLLSSFVNGV